jgi:2-keto-4-pentenoate hydratase/2-oxohepta-3-ene-1,7-dioic acid hydratase in catechol pathway
VTQWVRYRCANGRIGFGTLEARGIVEYAGDMFASPTPTGGVVPVSDAELAAPCSPSKIIALWNNYHELGAKLGKEAPRHPLFFIKPASSVIGPGDAIRRPAAYAARIVFEGELAIVIGRRCQNVAVEQAGDYIFGYTCINDVTAIDLLNENADFAQWCRAKSFDTFACIGPIIETSIEMASARVTSRLDGVERQNYPLSDMIFSPAEQVSRISQDMSLLPGDVIACGTSVGVGTIKDGSIIEIAIDGIGSLVNALAPASGEAA